MKRFWLSWEETSDDYRPITDPPNQAVLAWWCSGTAGDGSYSTLVAMVEAEDEIAAKRAVVLSWPPARGVAPMWRFCEERGFDWRPGDRFPISKGWSLERIEGRR
jgi:hypothetical protein